MADIRVNPRFVSEAIQKGRKRLQAYAAHLVNHIKRKLSGGRRGSVGINTVIRAGGPPHVDSEELRNSIRWQWKEGDPDTIQVGTSLRYGFVQEVGMTIRAKSKYMAIPLSKEAKAWQAQGGNALSFSQSRKTVILPARGQNKLIVEFKKKVTAIHYLLAVSVTIKPHPYLRPSVDETQSDAERIFSGTV